MVDRQLGGYPLRRRVVQGFPDKVFHFGHWHKFDLLWRKWLCKFGEIVQEGWAESRLWNHHLLLQLRLFLWHTGAPLWRSYNIIGSQSVQNTPERLFDWRIAWFRTYMHCRNIINSWQLGSIYSRRHIFEKFCDWIWFRSRTSIPPNKSLGARWSSTFSPNSRISHLLGHFYRTSSFSAFNHLLSLKILKVFKRERWRGKGGKFR